MKKYINITLVLVIIITVGIYSKNRTVKPVVVIPEPVIGCYVAHLDKDAYDLKIDSQNGEHVSGILTFNNYQKDSSHGPFAGTYKDGILLGTYTFESEGTTSVMQVIFKKVGNDFVRGYGEMTATNEFANLNDIAYDNSTVFKTGPCVENQ